MWFEKGNTLNATPVVFSARNQSVGESSVLQAWVRSRAQSRVPAAPEPSVEPGECVTEVNEEPALRTRPSVFPAVAPAIEKTEAAEQLIRIEREMLENLSDAIRDVHVLGSSLRSELEEQLVLLAAKMAQKVIRRELSLDPSIMAQLAREGIQALGDRHDVVIRIGRLPDSNQTEALVQQLQDEYPDTRIFVDDDRAPGECVVEAQLGRVDESVETRLDNVLHNILGTQMDIVGSGI